MVTGLLYPKQSRQRPHYYNPDKMDFKTYQLDIIQPYERRPIIHDTGYYNRIV